MSGIAAVVRRQVEQVLAARLPGALSPRIHTERERVPTGVAGVDALLAGGVPVGAITEMVGPQCSGRTTIALHMVAALTQAGKVCAWVDVSDALDPQAAAAAGVVLSRLLWVRCGAGTAAQAATPARVEVRSALLEEIALQGRPVGAGHCGGGSQHPRNEVRGVSEALGQVLNGEAPSSVRRQLHADSGRRTAGTQEGGRSGAAANSRIVAPVPKFQKGISARARSVARHEVWRAPAAAERTPTREEQVPFDRLPPRRGENVRLGSAASTVTTAPAETITQHGSAAHARRTAQRSSMRDGGALDQALRAADLLLMNGGFSALVLDLGSTPAAAAWRIPLATWFRYRAACEHGRTSLLLLTQHGCAKSSAEVVVRLRGGDLESEGPVLTGVRFEAELERRRFARNAEKDTHIASAPKVVSIRSANAVHPASAEESSTPDVHRPWPPQSAHATAWSRAMSWVRAGR